MHSDAHVYRFGPYELDAASRRLTRNGDPVPLHGAQMDVLLLLLAQPGKIVSKRTLEKAWHGADISQNSIAQAIRGLRQALGELPGGLPYIETATGYGYRFAAPMLAGRVPLDGGARPAAPIDTGSPRRASEEELHALLEPYRALAHGPEALEAFDREGLERAHRAFHTALQLDPDFPMAHVGLANAMLLTFEATRTGIDGDDSAIGRADDHARTACRLDPNSPDAWGTLAIVRYRLGDATEAIAAARKAVSLDPQELRHHLRVAFVSWGRLRLRAAERVLLLWPGLALGHWFVITVLVAREQFDEALPHLRAGCDAQDRQDRNGEPYAAVGLHLLHGLVLAARGTLDAAREELRREIALENLRHIYGPLCSANTWYALGALELREGRLQPARDAFEQALTRRPGHALASIGLSAIAGDTSENGNQPHAGSFGALGAATTSAARHALRGEHADAARVWHKAFLGAAKGQDGWELPVEPLLNIPANRASWSAALAKLRSRAF